MSRPALPRGPLVDSTGQPTRDAWLYLRQAASTASWDTIDGKPSTFPPSSHGHPISEIVSLQATLDAKAALAHTHAISDVTGLQTALDAFVPTVPAFVDLTEQATATLLESAGVTITGSSVFTFLVRGQGTPEVQVAGGAWGVSGVARTGEEIKLRLTSSGSGATAHVATLYFHGGSAVWTVTTA